MMKMKMLKIMYVGAAVLMLLPLVAGAAVVVNDAFTDGGRTDGTDAQDVAWYTTSGGSLSVGTDNAMTFITSMVIGTNEKWQRRIVGQMAETTIATGESLKLSFDATFDCSVAGANRTLRFGLFNSNGTTFSADAVDPNVSAAADNDQGYLAALSISTAVRGVLYAEKAGATDLTFMGGSLSTVQDYPTLAGLDELTTYALALIITNTGSGVTMQYLQDNVLTMERTTAYTTNLYLTFDEIGIAGGVAGLPTGGTALDMVIDNVVVELIPEPATIALLTLGFIALRKRK